MSQLHGVLCTSVTPGKGTHCQLVLIPTGMQQASINLTKSLHEVYEPDWFGQEEVMSIGKVRVITGSCDPLFETNNSMIPGSHYQCFLQDCDAFWEDFHNKLVDSTLLNLDEYLQHFPDLKVRENLGPLTFSLL